jgi:hypothetical protein
MNFRIPLLFFFLGTALLIFTGCRKPLQEEITSGSAAEKGLDTLSVLNGRFNKVLPVKANGHCSLFYYLEGKPRRESFPVQLWVNPPDELYLQGDVAFDAKGIVIGSNAQQFWLAMQPNEISSYWWGDWSQQSSHGTMLINPHVVLEGLGIVDVSNKKNWTFSRRDSVEVFTNRQNGSSVKRIFVGSSDRRIRRIEYVGIEGEAVTVAELDKYVKVAEGFYVPAEIKIIRRIAKNKSDFVSITLKISTIKSVSYTDEHRQHLFQRRQMKGFKHIYQIIDGNSIE